LCYDETRDGGNKMENEKYIKEFEIFNENKGLSHATIITQLLMILSAFF